MGAVLMPRAASSLSPIAYAQCIHPSVHCVLEPPEPHVVEFKAEQGRQYSCSAYKVNRDVSQRTLRPNAAG